MELGMFLHTLDDRAVSRVVVSLCERIAGHNTSVTILHATKRGSPTIPSGVATVDLGTRDKSTSFAIPALVRYLRRNRLDVLVAHSDGPIRASVIARMLARTDTRLIAVAHTNYSTSGSSHRWLRDRLVRSLYPRSDIVAAPSPEVLDDLEAVAPRISGRRLVLPNPGPDPQQVAATAPGVHPWSGDDDVQLVVSVGNVIRNKGHDILIKAFQQVAEHRPRARLLIVGRFDDPDYHAELLAMVEESYLTDRVSLAGYAPSALPAMRAADLFVSAARTAASPLVLVEALACGVPIIAAQCPGGTAWVLGYGQYGVLVPPEDPDSLAVAMVDVLGSEKEQRTLSAVGPERAADFSPTKAAANYLDAARALVGSDRGVGAK